MKPFLLTTKLALWKKINDDEEFVEKAIDSLYKKLKSKSGAIEDLEKVLANQNPCSECITLTRSLDGRLQVSHRKGLPHVIYCRIFRWPDLQNQHELRGIPSCKYTFASKQVEICINPYHYERVIDTNILPNLRPRHVEFSAGHSHIQTNQKNANYIIPSSSLTGQYQYNSHQTAQSCVYPNNYENFSNNPQQYLEKENSYNQILPSNASSHNFNQSSSLCNNSNNLKANIEYNYYYYYNDNSNYIDRNLSNNIATIPPAVNSTNPNNSLTYSSYANNSIRNDSHEESLVECSSSNLSPATTSSSSTSSSSSSTSSLTNITTKGSKRRLSSTDENMLKNANSYYQYKPECPNWCSIVYYELNSRIGEIFHSNSNQIFVDGFTNPCMNKGRRLCLGMFTNINRNPSIENCRKHIGRGIHVYNDNGDAYVENLSSCPIFVQSRSCNFENGFHQDTVYKLISGCSLRVFQSKKFDELLKDAINRGYDSVYELSNMCVIKVSFVKGWGVAYYRKDVSSCPCWIELRLNTPFLWMDKILKELGSSTNPITSVS